MSPRTSLRGDRRRRVMVDDSSNDDVTPRPRIFRGESDGPVARYNQAALHAINAPIASYLPLRPYCLVVWFLTGLIPIMGLLLLDVKRPAMMSVVGTDAVRVFDLSADGNFAAWLSSITFACTVLIMMCIYSVRRHRRDDYRGRFTVWGWAIAVVGIASVDSTVGLHDFWQGLCQFVTGTTLWGDGSIWWVGAWAVVVGGTVLRLSYEMSSSRQAIGWACAASVCYLWSGLAELGLTPIASQQSSSASRVAALLLGHHLMLFSLVQYAREVVLEAMGMIESPAVRKAKAPSAKSRKVSATETKTSAKKARKAGKQPVTKTVTNKDAPKLHTVAPDQGGEDTSNLAPLATRAKAAKPNLKAVHATEEDNGDEGANHKLSKADKRRIRKEQRRRKAA